VNNSASRDNHGTDCGETIGVIRKSYAFVPTPQDTTPLAWENNIRFWRELHEVVDKEVPNPRFHTMYGELATLGIEKGKPFNPDARLTGILEKAVKIGNAQMRVESFGDRRPDRIVWLPYDLRMAIFNTPNYVDLYARDKWFYQAIGASPAMFKRDTTAGSLYWLALRDNTGATLDRGESYKLSVPQPVPGKLFLVCDRVRHRDAFAGTDQTEQGRIAIAVRVERCERRDDGTLFRPSTPNGKEGQWIHTIPGKGWFVYFRVYGPEKPAFDGSWKPGDFEQLR
jgi:hypothetical protein